MCSSNLEVQRFAASESEWFAGLDGGLNSKGAQGSQGVSWRAMRTICSCRFTRAPFQRPRDHCFENFLGCSLLIVLVGHLRLLLEKCNCGTWDLVGSIPFRPPNFELATPAHPPKKKSTPLPSPLNQLCTISRPQIVCLLAFKRTGCTEARIRSLTIHVPNGGCDA